MSREKSSVSPGPRLRRRAQSVWVGEALHGNGEPSAVGEAADAHGRAVEGAPVDAGVRHVPHDERDRDPGAGDERREGAAQLQAERAVGRRVLRLFARDREHALLRLRRGWRVRGPGRAGGEAEEQREVCEEAHAVRIRRPAMRSCASSQAQRCRVRHSPSPGPHLVF